MDPDSWTCLMECTAILGLDNASDRNPDGDYLHMFQSKDNDGSLTQVIEGNDLCKVGELVRVSITKVK